MYSQNGKLLNQFIAEHSHKLLRVFRSYVLRMGLATRDSTQVIADELLTGVTIEALEHAERFDPTQQPMAWLLGIAANLIKRKRAELSKLDKCEPLIRDIYQDKAWLSDEELFDVLTQNTAIQDQYPTEANAEIAVLLEGASLDDQNIIRLAIFNDLDGEALAKALNISPGAARVRLHRALRRLRTNQVFVEQHNEQR